MHTEEVLLFTFKCPTVHLLVAQANFAFASYVHMYIQCTIPQTAVLSFLTDYWYSGLKDLATTKVVLGQVKCQMTFSS